MSLFRLLILPAIEYWGTIFYKFKHCPTSTLCYFVAVSEQMQLNNFCFYAKNVRIPPFNFAGILVEGPWRRARLSPYIAQRGISP